MPTQEEKKTLNIFDEKVFSDLTKLVEEKGYTQYRAVEGAIRAFIALPDELQVALMKGNNQNVYKLLIHSLRDIELTKNLQALSPEQRLVLIESAKEVTKRLFPKKKDQK